MKEECIMEKKNIGLGPSGGTASSMAAACKFIVEEFSDEYNVWALPECWRLLAGISDGKCHLLTPEEVKDWDKIGGSPFIPSCKDTNVFKIPNGANRFVDLSHKVKEFYDKMNFHCVLYVGGGGTTLQISRLSMLYPQLHSEVLLATMDNDVCCFENSLGFDTAVKNNVDTIIAGISDAYTMQRPTMIFTMGYDTGIVAYEAGLRAQELTGKVNFIYLPESQMDINMFSKYLKENYYGAGTFVGVCSEGVCRSIGGADGIHKKFEISEFCAEVTKKSGISFKALQGDYRQRSGVPTKFDVELARKYAKRAHELVLTEQWNQVIGGDDANYLPFNFVKDTILSNNTRPYLHSIHVEPTIVL